MPYDNDDTLDKNSKIWRAYIKGVEPMVKYNILNTQKQPASSPLPPISLPVINQKKAILLHSHKTLNEQINHNHAFSVEKNAKKRMKKGKFIFDAKIDLHGQTQEQAFDSLHKFITYHYQKHIRHLLVITGRGRYCYQTLSSLGVLIKKVPEWLKNPPFSQMISVIEPASVYDGGEGALYVILRNT